MKQIRLDFSDETDKVLLDTQGNQISFKDILAAIRCLTTVSLNLVKRNNGEVDHALYLVSDAVCQGYKRFINRDIIENPEDLSPWRKEESNE